MIKYKLKAAPTAVSKEQNSQKQPKANRIVIGVDAHLKSYQAARKIDKPTSPEPVTLPLIASWILAGIALLLIPFSI